MLDAHRAGARRTASTAEQPAADGDCLRRGRHDEPAAPGVADFEGPCRTAEPQGLAALELDPYRDVALVYAPCPRTADDRARRSSTHCEKLRFRFAVIDCRQGRTTRPLDPRSVDHGHAVRGVLLPVDRHLGSADRRAQARAARRPRARRLRAHRHRARRVQGAGQRDRARRARRSSSTSTTSTQDALNPRGVNAIRSFPGRGIRVWGARTLTSNALWKYVSVRRLFIFLERSIYEGTQWVVFEPNDDKLWARVIDTIRLFLRTQWRLGALFGRTEEEAFFITCDRTTMTQDDILNGRLICEIGIAPVRPAEFVIFRIFQNTAEAQR